VEPAVAFGKAVHARRKRAGLTQEQLALNADLQRVFVSWIEGGKKQATLGTMLKLAAALDCKASELLVDAEALLEGDWADNSTPGRCPRRRGQAGPASRAFTASRHTFGSPSLTAFKAPRFSRKQWRDGAVASRKCPSAWWPAWPPTAEGSAPSTHVAHPAADALQRPNVGLGFGSVDS
jgi:transcriptional regulator with XRE-family HTH domain